MAEIYIAGVDAPTFTEVSTANPQFIDTDVFLGDENGALNQVFDGGIFRVSGLLTSDRVSIGDIGVVTFNAATGEVMTFGNVVGIATGGVGESLVIRFNSNATALAVESVIEAITYQSTLPLPPASIRWFTSCTTARGTATSSIRPGPLPRASSARSAANSPRRPSPTWTATATSTC